MLVFGLIAATQFPPGEVCAQITALSTYVKMPCVSLRQNFLEGTAKGMLVARKDALTTEYAQHRRRNTADCTHAK